MSYSTPGNRRTRKATQGLVEKKRNTNIGVGVGLVLQFAGNILLNNGYDVATLLLGLALLLAGLGLFVWGCISYRQGKGYSGWLGLLGLLSIFGLVVLVLLPDRHKTRR